MLDLRQMAAALGGIVSNNRVLAPGPGHSREDRSLSVKIAPDAPEGFIVHSFAPGDDPIACRDYVRQRLNLPPFQPNGRRRRTSTEIEALLAAAVDFQRNPKGTLVATFHYVDHNGTLLYEVLKYIDPKRFLQRSPDGKGGWVWSVGERRVLYRLPELLKYPSATVFLTEGEKDADRVAELGHCATTVASGKWTDECVQALAGREVIILKDNDDTGRKKAADAAAVLHGVANSVRVVSLPGLAEHGDVSDWLDAGNSPDQLIDVCFATPLWTPPAGGAQPITATENTPAVTPELLPLPFINITAWHDQPVPEREWCVRDRIPMRNVTLFSGEGSIGKSIVSLQLAVALVLQKYWFGTMPEKGPALVVCCEDDESEIHRRLSSVLDHYGGTFADMKDLHVMSFAGQDALLATPDRYGLIRPTKLFAQLNAAACDLHPRLIVLDNSADIFGGGENDRAQVRQFIGILRGLAIAAGAGVLLTSHPSLTGISSGSGISGSTAWHASVRSRLYMKRAVTEKDEEPDPNLRVIEIMKNNYGPVGETIMVRWKDGVFAPVEAIGTLQKMAADNAADDLFLKLLDRFTEQGRRVAHAKTSNNYAPTLFTTDPDGMGKRKELIAAMGRLFATGKIRAERYNRQGSTRVVRCS
jgi:RecA-family ATPase